MVFVFNLRTGFRECAESASARWSVCQDGPFLNQILAISPSISIFGHNICQSGASSYFTLSLSLWGKKLFALSV